MIPRRMTDHLTAAIAVHERWLSALADRLGGAPHLPCAGAVGDDHACALGAWLHGPEIGAEVRAGAAWQVVARLHREMHETAAEVQQLAEAGRLQDAEVLLAETCAARSQNLVAALQKWRLELALAPPPR